MRMRKKRKRKEKTRVSCDPKKGTAAGGKRGKREGDGPNGGKKEEKGSQ